jgi:drug/metabolite transporter (DMT)-like permease
VFVTLAGNAGASLDATLFWRYALGAGLLGWMAGGLRRLAEPGVRGLRAAIVLGTMQAAVAFVSLSALRFIPAATLTFLFYTYPVWIMILEAARGRERLTARSVAALVLALGGVAAMVGGGLALDGRGVLLALASALLYAVYVPVIGGFQRAIPTHVVAAYASAGAAVAFAVSTLATRGGTGFVLPPTGWAMVALLAVLSTAVGFHLFLTGLAVLGPVRASILSTVEPFCAAILAAVVLGQRITAAAVAGGALIAAAVVVLQWRPRARQVPAD